MITIYTHTWNPLTKEFWKWVVRKLARKFSGPDAVACSVVRGLQELNVPFLYNPLFRQNDTAVVLSGVCALKNAIAAKKRGALKKLIAGPNVVMQPDAEHGIMQSEYIDHILVPSQWVADLWAHQAPDISRKLIVWAAGVEIKNASTRTGVPILYDKLGDRALTSQIQQQIGSSAKIFTYGTFKREDYLKSLTEASFMVYLSRSESQGLALQEAWAHDVPTIINKSTNWQNNGLSWQASQINCPYLHPALGMIFENVQDIPELARQITSLHPKHYCDQELSDRASIQNLLKII